MNESIHNEWRYLPRYWTKLKDLQARTDRPMKGPGKSAFELEERFRKETHRDRSNHRSAGAVRESYVIQQRRNTMRLIDIEPILDAAKLAGKEYVSIDFLKGFEQVDAAPVVRGKWIHGCTDGAGTEFCYCSACGEDALRDKGGYTEFSRYCPHCGAKMDGKDGNSK